MLHKVLILSLSFASFACAAAIPSAKAIFQTVHDRLNYMEDVALYKAIHHKAIEDIPREDVVIQKAAQSAQQYKLDPTSSANLAKAQISVAKAIQYRYRADLLSQPTTRQPRDLKQVVRPTLIVLDNQLNEQLSEYLAAGHHFTQKEWPEFQTILNNHYLSQSDKHLLFSALEKVRRKV